MAETINFDKERASHYLDCIASGDPLEGPWNFDNMLTLAGVLLFAARSHGSLPQRLQSGGAGFLALEKLPAEYLVSTDAQFIKDSNGAVEFYAYLAQMVKDHEYDDCFEPRFLGFVTQDEHKRNIHPMLGHKPGTLFDDDEDEDEDDE